MINSDEPENLDPEVFVRMPDRVFTFEDFIKDIPIDAREVFDHIRDIKDPEHPMTLEELGVVQLDLIQVDNERKICTVQFKPTVAHCSLATLIGLCIKIQLIRLLPFGYKVDVEIAPGTHSDIDQINKQLADKECVAAACENVYLLQKVNDCLMLTEPQTLPKFIVEELQKSNKIRHPEVVYIQRSRQHIESYRRWRYLLQYIKK